MIRIEQSKKIRGLLTGGFLLLAALFVHVRILPLAGLAALFSIAFWWLSDERYEIRYAEDRYFVRHRRRFRERIWHAVVPAHPAPFVSEFIAGWGRRSGYAVVFSSDAGPLRFNFFADRRRVERWLSQVTADAARGDDCTARLPLAVRSSPWELPLDRPRSKLESAFRPAPAGADIAVMSEIDRECHGDNCCSYLGFDPPPDAHDRRSVRRRTCRRGTSTRPFKSGGMRILVGILGCGTR